MPQGLQQGQLCRARITPQRGEPKLRPIILVTRNEEIGAPTLEFVAVSSTFTEPLADDQIELPWERSGNCATGLRRRSVAVCSWLDRINRDEIQEVIGIVPPPILHRILDCLRRKLL